MIAALPSISPNGLANTTGNHSMMLVWMQNLLAILEGFFYV
jgi:hypothetical protein